MGRQALVPVRSLSKLANKINVEHGEALRCARQSLIHARQAGLWLIEAKQLVRSQSGHGHWINWIKENLDCSVRTVQAYMQLADRWDELETKAQAQDIAHLGVERALNLIAAPKPNSRKVALLTTVHEPKNSKSKKSLPRWTIHQGDVGVVLPTLGPAEYDAVISDPPYGLTFMGQSWDEEIPSVEVWTAIRQVCKPGAYLLAFGSPATSHRLATRIEDAGWEIRDTICWIYGSGFPKGQTIGKAVSKLSSASEHASRWNGYSTALKPAWEPVIVAQAPRDGDFTSNALLHGCGAMNIDGCRVGSNGGTKRSHQADYPRNDNGRENREQWARSGHEVLPIDGGRWPANVILDEVAAEELDRQSGTTRSRSGSYKDTIDVGNGRTLHRFASRSEAPHGYDDEGGASRFFYVAKASGKERKNNDHPTVKPVTLCEYLARLVLPPAGGPPRKLLIPYAGSGSEMIGGLMAGWDHVAGVEISAKYVKIAKRRLGDFEKNKSK